MVAHYITLTPTQEPDYSGSFFRQGVPGYNNSIMEDKRENRKVLVDADACPVNKYNYKNSKKYGVRVIPVFLTPAIFSDDDYAEVVVTGKGRDAADFVLVNNAKQGDIVVTHDYGLAAMACSKAPRPFIPWVYLY